MKAQHIIFIIALTLATACTVLVMHKPKAPVDIDLDQGVAAPIDTIKVDTIH